jgi:hypothetical protein
LLTKSELTDGDRQELARLDAAIDTLPVGETAETAKAMSLIEESIKLLQRNQRPAP